MHDLEEVLAFGALQRAGGLRTMRERLLLVPAAVFDRVESTTPRRYALAVGLVGGVIVAASARGPVTGGRSRLTSR